MADYKNPPSETETKANDAVSSVSSQWDGLTKEQMADHAVEIATRQIMACYEFKKPRMERLARYWRLYDGKIDKKLRQLFNVPIPVFPGIIDTLNAEFDAPIILTFKEDNAADYFKAKKINAAFQLETTDTSENSKWASKLSMCRKYAIMEGRGILEYNAYSDPDYSSELSNVALKYFNFQPRGGLHLENHLFAGREDIEKTKDELIAGAMDGTYDKKQVKLLIDRGNDRDYLETKGGEMSQRLSRFRPLGLDVEMHSYVGQTVYTLCSHVLEIKGKRWYLFFHPWTRTWLRFEPYSEICSSQLYPWESWATHEDDENFLSKSYSDDIYAASDAIVAMFNQELTNREKRNFGARAYDKDMFKDVRKLDESMHRPDALVPADTKGGTKRIGDGIYEFKVGELQGTINLIDWISRTTGKNIGVTDLAMGQVGGNPNSKGLASVIFAEQRALAKRLSWASAPFQRLMAGLGKRYIYGLKDNMPSKMAIRLMGENGWDWDEITKLDLSTKKDLKIMIVSSDQQTQENQLRETKRQQALTLLIQDPTVNAKKRTEEILKFAEYDDEEVAEFLDAQTYADKKSLAKAAEAIQLIMEGKKPDQWFGATIAFVQKILDVANDKRTTLKDKYQILMDYGMGHIEIARGNIQRKVADMVNQKAMQTMTGTPGTPTANTPTAGGAPNPPPQNQSVNPGMPGGISKAMQTASANV